MMDDKSKEALQVAQEALEEAYRQIDYLHGKFTVTGTGAAVQAQIGQALGALAALRPCEGESKDTKQLAPKWEGEFKSFTQWMSRAQDVLASPSHRPAVCIDAIGRRCAIGKDFMRARDEGTFPIRYFWEFEAVAAPGAQTTEGAA